MWYLLQDCIQLQYSLISCFFYYIPLSVAEAVCFFFFFFLLASSHRDTLEYMTSIMYSIFSYFRGYSLNFCIWGTCLQTCCVNELIRLTWQTGEGEGGEGGVEIIIAELIFSPSQIWLIAPSCAYCLQPYPAVQTSSAPVSAALNTGQSTGTRACKRCTFTGRICIFTSRGDGRRRNANWKCTLGCCSLET